MRTDYQLKQLVKADGPERPDDVNKVADGLKYLVKEFGLQQGRKRFSQLIDIQPGSLHHHLMTWPKGYQGDWYLIERIYSKILAPGSQNWDMLITESIEAEALRNRPVYVTKYFQDTYFEGETFVDVGCGSGLVVDPLLKTGQLDHGKLIMVDQDKTALQAARDRISVMGRELKVCYKNTPIFPVKAYLSKHTKVIMCIGVFDYLSTRLMVRILKAWMSYLKPGGKIVLGNMANSCPNRDYMDLLGWNLHYRTADELLEIGSLACRMYEGSIYQLGSDPTGLNYFLHLER